jgi:hypothetical protein
MTTKVAASIAEVLVNGPREKICGWEVIRETSILEPRNTNPFNAGDIL